MARQRVSGVREAGGCQTPIRQKLVEGWAVDRTPPISSGRKHTEHASHEEFMTPRKARKSE